MSKVKLIVKPYQTLGGGRVIDLDFIIPENGQIIGVIRTDDTNEDGDTRASDDLSPVLGYGHINDLVGKLLTMIDATFTDKEQRQAMKDLYKQIAWEWHDSLNRPLHQLWSDERNSK